MNLVWVLVICINSTWAGCAQIEKSYMPDKESCFEALREIRFHNSAELASGEIAKSHVAHCKTEEKK